MTKVALVTGGSSGIGRCTAEALRNAGCVVYEFSRHEKPVEGIKHITNCKVFATSINELYCWYDLFQIILKIWKS